LSVAKKMANIYGDFYTEFDVGGVSTDIAVVDVRALEGNNPPLIDAVKMLAQEMTSLLQEKTKDEEVGSAARPGIKRSLSQHDDEGERLRDALIVARWRAQSYNQDDYVDLWDFSAQLELALPPPEKRSEALGRIASYCQMIREMLGHVVKASLYQGPNFQHSHGLSVYFPAARVRYNPTYNNLAFAQATGWSTFVKLYLDRTQRSVRREKDGDGPYAYEIQGTLPEVTLVPGSVRQPEKGSKRNPEKGSKMGPADADGYTKNGPEGWYRDGRTVRDDGMMNAAIGVAQEAKYQKG